MRITKTTARKVLEVVDQGLVKGLGLPKPGAMCVEAAVCYALGLPHSDQPLCVSPALRGPKIILNDAPWSSNEARTAGLRKLALLQLGTNVDFDEKLFSQRVALFTINVTLADLFESFEWGKEHASAMRAATEANAAAARAARDRVLGVFSAGVAEILVDMGVPGAKWLDLL